MAFTTISTLKLVAMTAVTPTTFELQHGCQHKSSYICLVLSEICIVVAALVVLLLSVFNNITAFPVILHLVIELRSKLVY